MGQVGLSGGVQNLAGGIGWDQLVFQISQVGSSRVRSFFILRVGSGRVGSGRVGSGHPEMTRSAGRSDTTREKTPLLANHDLSGARGRQGGGNPAIITFLLYQV